MRLRHRDSDLLCYASDHIEGCSCPGQYKQDRAVEANERGRGAGYEVECRRVKLSSHTMGGGIGYRLATVK